MLSCFTCQHLKTTKLRVTYTLENDHKKSRINKPCSRAWGLSLIPLAHVDETLDPYSHQHTRRPALDVDLRFIPFTTPARPSQQKAEQFQKGKEMIRRRFSIVVLIVALCGVATLGVAKPSKATNKALAKNHKHKNKPTGNHDLIDGDIDFDDLSPKDCATYMCVSQVASATEYMEAGCPGPFSRFEPETREDFAAEMNMGEVLLESSDFDG